MPRRLMRTLALAAVLVTAALAVLGAAGAAGEPRQKLVALTVLRDASSNIVGRVYFFQAKEKISVVATAAWLAPGFHGFHVHATGTCDAATSFTSAGGHENPHTKTHGQHAGDMPPLLVGADGTAWTSFRTDRFVDAEVFDADGSAVVVHAGPDNLAHVHLATAPTRAQARMPRRSARAMPARGSPAGSSGGRRAEQVQRAGSGCPGLARVRRLSSVAPSRLRQ